MNCNADKIKSEGKFGLIQRISLDNSVNERTSTSHKCPKVLGHLDLRMTIYE